MKPLFNAPKLVAKLASKSGDFRYEHTEVFNNFVIAEAYAKVAMLVDDVFILRPWKRIYEQMEAAKEAQDARLKMENKLEKQYPKVYARGKTQQEEDYESIESLTIGNLN